MPYQLVTPTASQETLDCLHTLFEQAHSGEVIGIAFVALKRRRRYTTGTCGECFRDPTLTRGMVAALEDELRAMVHSASFDDTHL
jgi:hypothetical protein